jgi:hypothetical protein
VGKNSIDKFYLKDREEREVDFLVTWGDGPWFLVECKMTGGKATSLNYFADCLKVDGFVKSQK